MHEKLRVVLVAGDLIYTNSDVEPAGKETSDLQYFWEAFPAGSGPLDRTTYLFTYLDVDPRRPSLTAIMEDYWRRMPDYQVKYLNLQSSSILFSSG